MTEEDKRLIRLDIAEGKTIQALEKLRSTIENTAIPSKNQYLNNTDIQINTLKESNNKFNTGVERREDNSRAQAMAATFVLDNLDSLEKEISKINNDKTKSL